VSRRIQLHVVDALHADHPVLDWDVLDRLTALFRAVLPYWLHTPYDLLRELDEVVRKLPITDRTTVEQLSPKRIAKYANRFHKRMRRKLRDRVVESVRVLRNYNPTIPDVNYVLAHCLVTLLAVGKDYLKLYERDIIAEPIEDEPDEDEPIAPEREYRRGIRLYDLVFPAIITQVIRSFAPAPANESDPPR
jgi:hypothetical protein